MVEEEMNCEKCGQKQKMLLTSWYCDCGINPIKSDSSEKLTEKW
jgi:hypothetical protein